MQLRKLSACKGKCLEVLIKRNARQLLFQVGVESSSVIGRVEDAIYVIEDVLLADLIAAVLLSPPHEDMRIRFAEHPKRFVRYGVVADILLHMLR